jgi:exosortase A
MSNPILAADTETASPGLRLAWIAHGTVWLCLLALLLALNWSIVQAAFQVWRVSPTYSHCFFILPISAFLIWLRRRRLSQIAPAAEPLVLLLALPLIGLNLLATIASITEAQQLALVGMMQILTLAILGRRAYGQMLFPMLYLFFLVPMGEYLVGPMQSFTTSFISAGLSALGILHHTEGTIIELVGGTFRVAEACAGLRFLIATIAVGALFCYLNFRRWYKIAAFMLACAIVPVLANGVRALGIVLLAHISNNRIATGTDHLVYGWGFSVAILAILMFTGARFSDPEPESFAGAAPARDMAEHGPTTLFLSLMFGCLVIAAIPIFRLWDNERSVTFDPAVLAKPETAGGWQAGAPSHIWSPAYVLPDYKLQYALHRQGEFAPAVDVHLLYYVKSQNGHGLISSSNALWDEGEWHLLSQTSRTISFGGQIVPAQEILISSQRGIEMVWWTFWEDGRFTTSPARVKIDSVRRILGGHDGTALLAISTLVDSDPAVAAERLNAALANMANLPNALNKAAGRTDISAEKS